MLGNMLAMKITREMLAEYWPIFGLIVGMYVLMTFRTAKQMGRSGRNATKWFIITFFLTAIPAGIVLLWDNFGWLITGDKASEGGTADE